VCLAKRAPPKTRGQDALEPGACRKNVQMPEDIGFKDEKPEIRALSTDLPTDTVQNIGMTRQTVRGCIRSSRHPRWQDRSDAGRLNYRFYNSTITVAFPILTIVM
jgi:hypothetical protein